MQEKWEIYLNDETLDDRKSGEFYLEIAKSVEQIEVQITLASNQWCQVTLHDKSGARGQVLKTHLQEKVVGFIGQSVATTSATMIAGSIPSGVWRVTYEIEGEVKVQSALHLTILQHATNQWIEEGTENIMVHPKSNHKTGWVKGDLHTHTIFSDGKMSRENNLCSAAKQELDFFVATDHQVVTHLWPKSDIAVYAGVELTTPMGHGNFLGVNHLLVEAYEISSLPIHTQMMDLIKKNRGNGLFSVNHPFLEPWEWQLDELPLAWIDALELCNDPTFHDNTAATEKALHFWSKLWNDGWKIPGVGGSDSHLLMTEKYPGSELPSLIGDPATYIHVRALNQEDLLKGIKEGKTLLSRTGKIFLSSLEDREILPGQQMKRLTGTLEVAIEGDQFVTFEWVLDGQIVQTKSGTVSTFTYQFNQEDYHWLRVDIRGDQGIFLGTMTPIYWHNQPSKFSIWKDVYDG